MNIVFRADASLDIGTGHVMRCLTIAEALRERGANCRFVCRSHPGNLLELIRLRGFKLHVLPVQSPLLLLGEEIGEREITHAVWLGTDWATDAEQTQAVLGEMQFDWLIVDHYALDARWETAVQKLFKQTMVIDDLANRKHVCDALIDEAYHKNYLSRYNQLVSNKCRKLLGARYTPISKKFIEARKINRIRDGNISHILITLGGSSVSRYASEIVAALLDLGLKNVFIDMVIRKSPDPTDKYSSIIDLMPLNVYVEPVELAPLMYIADLAVCAGGFTSYELAYMGVPSILIPATKSQSELTEGLAEMGAAINMGFFKDFDERKFLNLCAELITSRDKYLSLSRNGSMLIDGLGVQRIVAFILEGVYED
jgi:UDP-2,4-diacetamido-2,4,6-trideoxy-beta-L-altropyranose hydrolase